MTGETVIDEVARRTIREAILRHVERYPDASDTAEGIQRFWLSSYDLGSDPAVVVDVLEELVRDGVLRKRRLPGGEVIFNVARPPQT